MGACVSSSPATSTDALEGSRAPTNTPEAKSSAPPKPSDGLTARTPRRSTGPRPPRPRTPGHPAPPRVDRRSTGHRSAARVRQRAESLEREEQFQFTAETNGDTTARGTRRRPRRRARPSTGCTRGLASPDPLSPHPLSPDPPSESEGEGPREEDEEARNDEKENDDDATPLRKGRTLVRASTPEGERVVVSPALKRVA